MVISKQSRPKVRRARKFEPVDLERLYFADADVSNRVRRRVSHHLFWIIKDSTGYHMWGVTDNSIDDIINGLYVPGAEWIRYGNN